LWCACRFVDQVMQVGGFDQMNSVRGNWMKVFQTMPNYSSTMTSASSSLKNSYQKYLLAFERSLGDMEVDDLDSGHGITANWARFKDCVSCCDRVSTRSLPRRAEKPTAVECRFCNGRYHLRCLQTPLLRPQMKSWACETCSASRGIPIADATKVDDDDVAPKKPRLSIGNKDDSAHTIAVDSVSNEVLSVTTL